ncbi:hypothetical protein K490DRAFT_1807, partial [Saccharata proteae CBS 121410]
LLGLPLELREHIYSYILHPVEVRVHQGKQTRYKYDLSLFRVNHQVYHEARDIFRKLNVFTRIETPWPEAEMHIAEEGKVPIVASGKNANDCPDARLIVDISAFQFDFQHAKHDMLLLVQDLPAFAKSWMYSDLSHLGLNSHLRLILTLRDPFPSNPDKPEPLPKALQQKLLLPFGDIKNLDRTTVNGLADPAVVSALTAAQNIPYKTPEECLEESTRLLNEGVALLNKDQFDDAKRLFEQSFLAIHIVVDGRERSIWANAYFEAILRYGPGRGWHGQMTRLFLRVQLVAEMCSLYLKQKKWTEVKFWGMRSISLLRESMGVERDEDDEPVRGFVLGEHMGMIYLRTGIACMRLGELEQAKNLLKVASGYIP